MPPLLRVLLGIGGRMMLLPILPVIAAIALAYAGTHPPAPPAVSDPGSQGLYYDPVSIVSEDGTRLGGWLIPAVDARRVLLECDEVLKLRRPAIVLAHDYGQSPQQMLPLLGPLHDDGYGCCLPSPSAETGYHTAPDKPLASMNRWTCERRSNCFDVRRSSIQIGSRCRASAPEATSCSRPARPGGSAGTGGPRSPVMGPPTESLVRRIGPRQYPMRWMRSLCKWAFDTEYHVDVEELDVARLRSIVQARPTLRHCQRS